MISMSQEDAKSVMKALDDFDGWADHGCPPSTEVAVKIMRGVLAEQPAPVLETHCCQSCGAVIGSYPADYDAMECVDLECDSCGSTHGNTGCPAPDLAKQAIEKLAEIGWKWDFDAADFVAEQPAPVQQEPVAGVVLRDGQPTLLQDKHIKETDERLFCAATPAQQQEPVGLPARETPEMHDAVMEVLYQGGVTRTNTDALWQAYRKVLAAAQQPAQQQEPLTDEEISEIAINNPPMVHEFARAIEAKLKEKNT